MTIQHSLSGIPVTLILLIMVTVWVTLRDPRKVSAALLWGLTLNGLIVWVVGTLDGRLWEISEEASAWVMLGMAAGVYLSVLVLGLLLVSAGMKLISRESFSVAHSLSLALGVAILFYMVMVPVVLAKNLLWLGVLMLLLGLPLGYLAFILTSYLLYSWGYSVWVRRYAVQPKVITVLGAGLNGEELTPLLRARADLGVEMYERALAAGTEPILVASGGQGADEVVPEGVAIGRYLRSQGIERVVEETRSTSTEENLLFSRELVGDTARPWLAVSSDYHAFRAAILMRELRIPGNAVGAKTPLYFWSSAVLREYVALLVRHWKLNAVMLVILTAPVLVLLFGFVRGVVGAG